MILISQFYGKLTLTRMKFCCALVMDLRIVYLHRLQANRSLLVDKEITATQSNLLDDLQFDELKIYIVGGTGAVNNSVEKESAQYGVVKRLAGKTRYDTSKAVADEFFGNTSKAVDISIWTEFS